MARSATDLLMVGTPSMAVLSKLVPVPILIDPDLAAVVTTSSISETLTSVIATFEVSLRIKNKPSTDSRLYPVAEAVMV